MPAHNRRLKQIQFAVDGSNFECQVSSWRIDPGIDDGDHMYTFCPDGEFIEETDPEPTLDLTYFDDWRSGGISDFLWSHIGQTLDFTLDHHPDIPAEHVTWSGKVVVKPGPVGGDVRETESTELTLQLVGLPVYGRAA